MRRSEPKANALACALASVKVAIGPAAVLTLAIVSVACRSVQSCPLSNTYRWGRRHGDHALQQLIQPALPLCSRAHTPYVMLCVLWEGEVLYTVPDAVARARARIGDATAAAVALGHPGAKAAVQKKHNRLSNSSGHKAHQPSGGMRSFQGDTHHWKDARISCAFTRSRSRSWGPAGPI